MRTVEDEKRRWSEDGEFTLTRLVTYRHTSDSMPDSFEVRFNRTAVYVGDEQSEAITTFAMYEGIF